MSKKALLVLIGGRPMPNLLTIRHLKPELVIPVASPDAMRRGDWRDTLTPLQHFSPGSKIHEPIIVADAANPLATFQACCRAWQEHQQDEYDWFINITGGSKMMAIGAYWAASRLNAACWYLDTNERRVMVLEKGSDFQDVEALYNLNIVDYGLCYGRKVEQKPETVFPPEPRHIAAARYMVDYLAATLELVTAIDDQGSPQLIINHTAPTRILCDGLRQQHVLSAVMQRGGHLQLEVAPGERRFLKGDWLEIYAYDAASQAGSATGQKLDDCLYGHRFKVKETDNELDLAANWGAVLLVGECKTGKHAQDAKWINKLSAVAGYLGGAFVSRLFITDRPHLSDPFQAKARDQRIVLVTGPQLKDLSQIIWREIKEPTYARI